MTTIPIRKLCIGPGFIDFDPPCLEIPEFCWNRDDFPVAVISPNGSGKSSLALALTTAIPEAIWARVELPVQIYQGKTTVPDAQNIKVQLLPQMWQHFNLGYTLEAEFASLHAASPAWKELIWETLELQPLAKRKLTQLSDGERRRAMIGITLSAEPSLLISDEWATHLDSDWSQRIAHLFNSFHGRGGCHLSLLSSESDLLGDYVTVTGVSLGEMGASQRGFGEAITESLLQLETDCWTSSNHDWTLDLNQESPMNDNSLKASSGELIEVVGGNGAGKTTLLKNIWRKNHRSWNFFRRRSQSVKLILVDPIYQLQGPTVEDELRRHLGLSFLDEGYFRDISQIASKDVLSLSFGQRKVLAIIAGLISKFDVILIDEPFTGLDSSNQQVVHKMVKLARRNGKAIIVAQPRSVFNDSQVVRL